MAETLDAAAAAAKRTDGRRAAVHQIPTTRIVALEHPGIVRNFDRGFRSLGGEAQLKHVLDHRVGDSKYNNKQNEKPEPVAGVSLRPNDPLAKRIPSTGIETRNVLVKISTPKRTGRKRKRGSNEPFTAADTPEGPNTSITAPDLLRRLRDNVGKYTVETVGMVHETHRFRALPDFQLRGADVPLMRHIRDHAMVPDYDRLKHFQVDLSPTPVAHTALPGPPSFTSIDMPHKFEYRQPDTVVYIQDEVGQITTRNMAAAAKRVTWAILPDAKEIPTPPEGITALAPEVQKAIELLAALLEERPIVTKRVALNNLPPISETVFKEAMQYVGYSFRAGPFRDSLIKFGIDPRKDPRYRFYQTMMFQVDHQAFKSDGEMLKVANKPATDHSTLWARPLRHTKDDPTTHIFDGTAITANGKTWQVCDLTDPIIYHVFHTDNIRAECDVYQTGWFHNGTMGKARAIMKDKMRLLFAGEEEMPEEEYRRVVAVIPDELTKENFFQGILSQKMYGSYTARLGSDVRNIAKSMDSNRVSNGAAESWFGKDVARFRTGSNDHEEGNELGNVDEELRAMDQANQSGFEDAIAEGQGDLEGDIDTVMNENH